MNTMNRVAWVDLCKALGIILVVLGHTLRNDISLVYIYGFHMPLFFFLSGIVFNDHKYDWKSFLQSRFNSLIIPYVFFYLLTWLYWLLVERSFRPIDLQWWQPLFGMLYGAQWKGLMDHNGILWFLPCLFSVELMYFGICRLFPKTLYRAISVTIVAIVGLCITYPLPWCINVAMGAVQFFFIGHTCKEFLLYGEGVKSKYVVPAISLALIYIFLQRIFENEVNIATSKYGPLFIFEICAFIGVFALVYFTKCLSIKELNVQGGGVGRNTLVIFALHQPILRIVRYIVAKFFPIFPVETNLICALAVTLIIICVLVPIISIYNFTNKKYLSKINLK